MAQPSDSRKRVTVVGDALIDELRDPSGAREFVGGAALNVAVGLALLGDDATLVAMLGDDEPAEHIRTFLDDYAVRLVASPSERGTSRAVSIRTDGEPRYEFNEAAQHRRLRFDAATLDALDRADLVVVSCYPFDDDEQVELLLGAIADPGHRLVVDGNPRSGMLHDRARFLANFERVAARSLLVKVGDEDADLLLGAPLAEFVRRLRGDGSAPDAAGPVVLATAGREGASLHHAGLEVHADIVSLPGPVVDTMGAGDATLAAVVHRIAEDGVPQSADGWTRALQEAMGIAAATVRHEGALLRTGVAPPQLGS
ncbi:MULTISPECIES: PfkB family carbohydrate kinase [unclassified Agromyces]|uniref:PfkB family carbohydrate kinase n=1 Tax=unclassified Agromyces TaxID=2639701 RepID=UPI003014D74F